MNLLNKSFSFTTLPFARFSLYPLVFFLLLFSCIDNNKNYYSHSDGNFEIMKAFLFKDILCGTTHTNVFILPGDSLKRDIDRCVKDIYMLDCSIWAVPHSVPFSCLGIEYK